MEREIRFRGKRVDNGEWVEGYYFKTPLTDEATGSKPEDGWFFLTGRERHCISKNGCAYEVDPSTVGQFTGLKDKNGKEIYEGDIISEEDFHNGIYLFREQPNKNIVVKYEVGAILGKRAGFTLDATVTKNVYAGEIIDNIYDTPDLLKG